MTNVLPLSSRIYARLLVFYPEDLRRDYGAEMALTFAEDLDTARHQAGGRGIIRVWRCALVEFLRFALPGCASSPAVRVPAISVAFSIGMMGFGLVLRGATDAPMWYRAACTLPTFATVLTPLLVIWVCRGKAVLSLGLCNHTGEGK
jgi:hypothetical protein